MKPKIEEKGPTMLAGMVYYGDPFAAGGGCKVTSVAPQDPASGRCPNQTTAGCSARIA